MSKKCVKIFRYHDRISDLRFRISETGYIGFGKLYTYVIPLKRGILLYYFKIPAFAGMTKKRNIYNRI